MKLFGLLLATAVGFSAAQQATLPTCAQPCVTQFTTGTSIAGCTQFNVACICANSDFLNGVACCLASVCSQADQNQAVLYAKQMCTVVGVAVPDQVSCHSSQTGSATGLTLTPSPTTSPTTTGIIITITPTTTSSSTPNEAPSRGLSEFGTLGSGILAILAMLW